MGVAKVFELDLGTIFLLSSICLIVAFMVYNECKGRLGRIFDPVDDWVIVEISAIEFCVCLLGMFLSCLLTGIGLFGFWLVFFI